MPVEAQKRLTQPGPQRPLRKRPLTERMAHVLSVLFVLLGLSGCSKPPYEPDAEAKDIDTIDRYSFDLPAGYALSYLKAGTDRGQAAILVHGTPGKAAGWADYLLDHQHKGMLLAPDRPGFGFSGPDDAVTSLHEQARALIALADTEKLERPVLVGHSLGGPIIVQAAIDAPERFGALVILAGSLDPGQEKLHYMQPVGEWWGVRNLLPRFYRNANRELIALEPQLLALEKRLADVRIPVVIVHGTIDKLVPYANVPFMQKHMTNAAPLELVRLEGQNHFLPWNSRPVVWEAMARAMALRDDTDPEQERE
jgi:pimeloyl-ACP methyl ester carboxylesterase